MSKYRIVNPATEENIEEFETAPDQEVRQVLEKSWETFQEWRKTGFEERRQKMRKVADLLRENSKELSETMTEEMGKPINSAKSEVEKCAWVCEHYASYAESYLSEKNIPTDAQKSTVRYEPLGPVFAIMPWNFPLWQVMRFAAPNLMAGNVGILKHAPNVPKTAAKIEEIFKDAGFSEGVFQNIYVTNDQASKIIADDRVRGVTLTGSTGAGKAVARQAGENLKKTVLELGGSDPFIILEDADIEKACEVATTSRLLNNGQSCIAAKRIIVHEDIADECLEMLKNQFESMQIGNPANEDVDIGPIARKDLRDELAAQVEESVKAGAEVVTGGSIPDRNGFFYEPTILRDIPEETPAYEEELFGPVASVFTVSSEKEAVEIANRTPYGLGASIWTQDLERAERLSRELEAGNVFVNELVKSDPRLPFGGVKNSGYGRELGEEGIKEFVNRKTLYID